MPFLQKKPTYLKSVVFFDQSHRYLFFDHCIYIFFVFQIVFPNLFATNVMLVWFVIIYHFTVGNSLAYAIY